MRRLLSAILALYLAAGVLPVQILAEETEEPVEEQSEVIEETEEITEEETEDVIEEELPAEEEEILPEETEEPLIEETEVPEITEEPVIPEVAEERVQTEEPVIEETEVPDPVAEEILPEESAEPVTEEPAAEEIIPSEEPAPEEIFVQEDEPVIEVQEEIPEETSEPEETEEPVLIEEEIEEQGEVTEAPDTYTLIFDANGGMFDKNFLDASEDKPTWSVEVEKDIPYHVQPNSYYKVYRSGYAFEGWYGDKSLEDQYKLVENSGFKPWYDCETFTVYAKWAPAHTVTFSTNGGMFADESDSCIKEVAKGKVIGSCPMGTPSGYDKVFAGWTLKKNNAKTQISPDYYVPQNSITLYALWADEIEVIYDANGGTFPSSATEMTVGYGKNQLANLSAVSQPSKSGYAFTGWYTDPSLDDKYKAANSYLVTKKMRLYAKYEKCWTITYSGNGKSWISGNIDGTYKSNLSSFKAYVPKGGFLTDAGIPYGTPPSGYVFAGWYLDKACSPQKKVNQYRYVPKGDTTLYAKWAKRFTITFEGNGGTCETGASKYTLQVSEDDAVGLSPGFTNGTKAFAGWYTDKACTKKVDYVYGYYPVKDTTFYAKWVTGVKVKFNANGGKFSDGSKTYVIYGIKGKQLRQNIEKPERSGYVFAGWYTDTTYTTKVSDPFFYQITGASQLYAKWLKAVAVKFDAGEGIIEAYNDSTGYFTTKSYTMYVGKGTLLSDQDQYEFHNISGAAGVSVFSLYGVPYPYVADVTGKEFEGWYKDKELKKQFDPAKDKITKAVTLYAKYKDIYSDSYVTITVDPNGGRFARYGARTFMRKKNSRFDYGTDMIVSPEGKVLIGYTTKKNDESTLLSYDFRVTKNMTVYAYYKPVFTITLNASSGFITSGSYGDGYIYSVFKVYTEQVIKGQTLERFCYDYGSEYDSLGTNVSGNVFLGWYSDKEFKNFVTYDISTYKVKKDITLYARWGKALKPGWKKTKGQWWYKLENGDYYRSTFRQIGKATYYFKPSGYIATGWNKINGYWYWFADSGAMAAGWKKISNKWYWFTSEGKMVTGWQKISGKWYYFESSGSMKTGWLKLSGKWYYLDTGGAMITGWKKIKGVWYYFESSGAMKTGWLKLSGKWYYLDSSGAMVTGTRTIGSKTYQFNSNGVCLNP